MKRKVTSNSFLSRASIVKMLTRIETSTIDTASSATMNLGSTVSARATATRWRCPPLNWCGYLSMTSRAGVRSTTSSSSSARASAAALVLDLVVAQQRRGEDVADRLRRVERRVRVLVDDLHRLAVAAEGGAVELLDRRALEDHFARSRFEQTGDHAPGRALAAAALAHETDRLARLDRKGNSVDGGDGLLALAKLLGQVAHFDDRRHQATSTATAMTSVRLSAPRCSGLRCSSASTSRQFQHAALCAGPTCSNSGSSCLQRSVAKVQRG